MHATFVVISVAMLAGACAKTPSASDVKNAGSSSGSAVAGTSTGVAASGTLAVGPRILFHWGSVAANNDLLSNAGYPHTAGHELQPGTTVVGTVNAALIGLTRTWYTNGGGSDAAGPGLYVSNNPYDSSSYGPDLLVVERVALASSLPLIDREPGYVVRQRTTAALAANNDSALPVMSLYTDSWNVIERVPVPADGVAMTIRPASLADADAYLDGAFTNQSADKTVIIAYFALSGVGSANSKSAGSSAFLTRVRDGVVTAILKVDLSQLTANPLPDSFFSGSSALQYLLQVLSASTPEDRQVGVTLAKHYAKALLTATHSLSAYEWVILSALDASDPAVRAKILAKFSQDAAAAPSIWMNGLPAIVSQSLSSASVTELAGVTDALTQGSLHATIELRDCAAVLATMTSLRGTVATWQTLVRDAATNCFSVTGLAQSPGMGGTDPQTFFHAYLNAYHAVQALPDTTPADLVAFVRDTVLAARSATTNNSAYGPDALLAAAVLVGVQSDEAVKSAMTAALTADLDAKPLQSHELRPASLSALRDSFPWVKLLGFQKGMLALAALEPSTKGDLTANLEGIRSSASDSLEQSNLTDLIDAINAN